MVYSIIVKPNSKKGPLVQADQDRLVVYLREKPIDGQANQALIKVLADYFQVPKTTIQIKSGARGRQKLVEILA